MFIMLLLGNLGGHDLRDCTTNSDSSGGHLENQLDQRGRAISYPLLLKLFCEEKKLKIKGERTKNKSSVLASMMSNKLSSL